MVCLCGMFVYTVLMSLFVSDTIVKHWADLLDDKAVNCPRPVRDENKINWVLMPRYEDQAIYQLCFKSSFPGVGVKV